MAGMLQGKTCLITAAFGLAKVGMVLDVRHNHWHCHFSFQAEVQLSRELLRRELRHVKLGSFNRSLAGFGRDR